MLPVRFPRRMAATYSASVAPPAWELTVTTTAGSQAWTINIAAGTNPAIRVDWGDGTVENFTTTGVKSHTYTGAGTYGARLSGSFVSGGNIRFGNDATDRPRLKRVGVAPVIPGLASFIATFASCTGLTGALPADLFRYNPLVATTVFAGTFQGCTGLTGAIPADLFRYNTLVSASGFQNTFQGCTGLTGIPTDLFKYNTVVSVDGIYRTFYGCTGLTGIPTDLFKYNTAVSTQGFYETFYGCTGLTSIPTDLFRYNTAVSTSGFYATFRGCTGLTSIPTDLFRYNTAISTSGFNQTFQGCTGLTGSIPADLFKYNTAVSTQGFKSAFNGCSNLLLSSTIFFQPGEEGTRFLNKVSDFTSCFQITSYTAGTPGTAPALWNCDFGTQTPVKTNCFTGHSGSTLTNYADIPAEWR